MSNDKNTNAISFDELSIEELNHLKNKIQEKVLTCQRKPFVFS